MGLVWIMMAWMAGAAHGATGGPDAFGYTYIDSREVNGPVYVWEDISGAGTPLSLADDGDTMIPIGFAFPYYESTYTQVDVSANGVLLFQDTLDSWISGSCLPSFTGYDTNRLMAVYWDDLDPSSGGQIYYDVRGVAPFRHLIVQWRLVPLYGALATVQTFQVALYESGIVEMRYRRLDDHGAGATMGIQGGAATGLPYQCSDNYVPNDLLVRYANCDVFTDADGDGSDACVDCDDNNANRYPGALETCDGVDADCDGADGYDDDGDGYGVCGGDCDDTRPNISPAASEIPCSGVDEDCDPSTLDEIDGDGDGAGECTDCNDDNAARSPTFNEIGCNNIDDDCNNATPDQGDNDGDGFSVCGDDCDDDDFDINPDGTEVRCNGDDDDCDPSTPDSVDRDGDGSSACDDCDDEDPNNAPLLEEVCDGFDNDCDEEIDEGCEDDEPGDTDVADDTDTTPVTDTDAPDPLDTDVRGVIGLDPNLPFGSLGCSCASGGGAVAWWWLGVLGLWARRRRSELV